MNDLMDNFFVILFITVCCVGSKYILGLARKNTLAKQLNF